MKHTMWDHALMRLADAQPDGNETTAAQLRYAALDGIASEAAFRAVVGETLLLCKAEIDELVREAMAYCQPVRKAG